MPDGQIAKAGELNGASNILFRNNSVTGVVEGRPNNAVWGGLNDILHSHNWSTAAFERPPTAPRRR